MGGKARTAGGAGEASLEGTGAFGAAFEHAPIGMALVDERGRPFGTNAALRKMLGYGKDDLEGMHFSQFTHPEDAAEDVSLFGELLAGEREGYRIEKRFVKKDGTTMWGRLGVSLARGASSGESPLVVAVVEDVTERRRAEEATRRLASFPELNPNPVVESDPSGEPTYLNPAAEKLFPDLPALGAAHPLLAGLPEAAADLCPQGAGSVVGEVEVGGRSYQRTVSRVASPGGGARLRVYALDVTEQGRAREKLEESEKLFRQLFENSADALFVHDEGGRVVDCNEEACRSLGYEREELLRLRVRDFAADVLSEEERRERGEDAPWRRALRAPPGKTVRFHHNLHRRKDGTTFPVEVGLGAVDYGGRRLVFASACDLTERAELEGRLAHMALHDGLTGLPNRTLLNERLGHALERASGGGGARSGEGSVAVLFLDLDDFKVVNDSLGHGQGDRLLVAVAERLSACLRPGDTLARLGGDEFVVLLEDVAGARGAEAVAERMGGALREPFDLGDGREVSASGSIGIALSTGSGTGSGTGPGCTAEDLLRDADVAMYASKKGGKGRYEVFDPGMGERARERLELEIGLRRALERGEFVVHYQPKVSMGSGGVEGYEALVRWEHPEEGLLAPGGFVPCAEETGLIVPLGAWVLEEACRQAQRWRAEWRAGPAPFAGTPGAAPPTVSVNLSPRQFGDPGLVGEVERTLRKTGLDPAALTLEITEGVVADDAEVAARRLGELKALGVGIAIDDFGTGYSSMSYLRRFPVDVLKIDRSFVAALGEDEEAEAIVGAMTDLARALGLRVVAEGVETAEQLEKLRGMGDGTEGDLAQGYYFARPLPAEELSGRSPLRGEIRSAGRAAIDPPTSPTNGGAPEER